MACNRTLTECYGEALAAGRRLLDALALPITEEMLDRLDVLIAERDTLIAAAVELVRSGAPSDGALSVLQELMEQQPIVEAKLSQGANGIRDGSATAQAARANIEGFRRLLTTGTQSRLLNERR